MSTSGRYFSPGVTVKIAPTPPPADPPWLEIALAEMGTAEIPGPEHNRRILEYSDHLLSIGISEDETPWCAAFCGWCILRAGLEPTRSALARSWMHWGQSIKVPRRGAVAILSRGNSPWMGHVGFYMGAEGMIDNHILLLGGNQADRVCIQSFPASRLLDVRWPRKEDLQA